eukprot:COSAG01_NODE_47836_length_386_cov_1.264808_1_plen_48_part_01
MLFLALPAPTYPLTAIRFGQPGKIPAQIPIFPAKSLVHARVASAGLGT